MRCTSGNDWGPGPAVRETTPAIGGRFAPVVRQRSGSRPRSGAACRGDGARLDRGAVARALALAGPACVIARHRAHGELDSSIGADAAVDRSEPDYTWTY